MREFRLPLPFNHPYIRRNYQSVVLWSLNVNNLNSLSSSSASRSFHLASLPRCSL